MLKLVKRLLLTLPIILTMLAVSKPAAAQAPCPFAIGSGCTTVTGTITDPSGIPYANATIAARLTPYDNPTISGQQFPMDYKTNLNVSGAFSFIVADTSRMTGSHQWVFTVNIFPAQAPPVGTGPQQFQVTLSISGSSQSITTQLTSAALALTTVPIGSGSFSAGGDLSGTAHSQTVIGIQGAPIPPTVTVVGTNSSRQLIDNSSATLSNNTTGTAANLSGTPLLPNGTSATTQSPGDTSAQLATDQFVANAVATVTPPYIAPQAISGCGVEWTGNLNFTVGACVYTINGVNYNSPLTNITLTTADPSNPRLDVLYVGTDSAVHILTGTPAATPAVPTTDPSTQLVVEPAILVNAGATTPANLVKVDIYHENVEWTTATGGTNAARVNTSSTNNPYDGTVDIEFGNGGTVATTTYAQATKPAAGTVDLGTYNLLTFYFRNKASWPNVKSLSVQWFNGSTPLGNPLVLTNGSLGLDTRTNVTSYQQISIPTSLFQINGIAATTVRFTITGGGAALTGFYLDDITLQGGVGQPSLPTTLMNWRGTYSSQVQYNPNDVVILNGFYYVALATNLNIPVTTTATWAGIPSCSTALTGQLLTMNNGAAPSCLSPGVGGRTVAGGSDTILGDSATALRDRATAIKYTNAGAIAITLGQAGSAGLSAHFIFTPWVTGAGGVGTITPTTSQINGASTLVLGQNVWCNVFSPDNSSYSGLCATWIKAGNGITPTYNADGSTSIAVGSPYTKLECSPGIGDGLNALSAGTYLQYNCVNKSGVTWTITGISCWTDNAGTSTLNAANNAATGLLTGAVTCNNTKSGGGAAGTQSGTTTLANNDAISFTFVADGTSKQTTWTVTFTQ